MSHTATAAVLFLEQAGCLPPLAFRLAVSALPAFQIHITTPVITSDSCMLSLCIQNGKQFTAVRAVNCC